MTVHGDGSAARDWLFVDDHCAALDTVIHVDRDKVVGQVLNLGTGADLSVLEIAQAVKNLVEAELPELVGADASGRRRTDVVTRLAGSSAAEIQFVGNDQAKCSGTPVMYAKPKNC